MRYVPGIIGGLCLGLILGAVVGFLFDLTNLTDGSRDSYLIAMNIGMFVAYLGSIGWAVIRSNRRDKQLFQGLSYDEESSERKKQETIRLARAKLAERHRPE